MSKATIKVINQSRVVEYQTNDINKELAGQKAMGLLEIPESWRLPFFVISKDVVERYMQIDEKNQEIFCKSIANNIKECTNDFGGLKDEVIIRSSGTEEGMDERGKYESTECKFDEIDICLSKMLGELKKQGEKPIAYVVQPYVDRKILGHLSNERRISQDSRDWKVEYEDIEKDPYSIGVRTWRKSYDYNELIVDNLLCIRENNIKEQLRKIAFYYTQIEKNNRFHLEFVWDGKRIYIVQKDIEIESLHAKNPLEYNIKVDNANDFNTMKAFRRIEQKDGEYYKKVKNVLLYEHIGLTVAPLYILDNKQKIIDMARGIFDEEIKHDFRLFSGKSVVIRTDVATEGADAVQLLPRSNELRTYEDVVTWCSENLCQVIQYEKVALLIHMFIPAISAAFAYAEPNSRVVTIQALWGLPEGLYYNAHDTFLLDTGTKNVGHLDEDKVMINRIVKDHKAVYIAPDEDGKWTEKKVKAPYDWKQSITEKQAKKIAIGSRLIAENVDEAISIMWFVGIDDEYYHTDCIPWFHEIYGKNTFSHEVYKKKYYTENEVVITCEDDLKKCDTIENLKMITIHPKDDKTLRNRNFIESVGSFASEHGITIFLEGTILAHPVYALASKGVRIILAKKNKEIIEKNNFNKLVRDKIPDKIIGNMEQIKCYRAKGDLLIRYLKEKLVEEIFEACDSRDANELLDELADVYEVLVTIQDKLSDISTYKNIRRKRLAGSASDGEKLVAFSSKSLLNNKIEENDRCHYSDVNILIEREHQCIEVELTITSVSSSFSDKNKQANVWEDSVLRLAYQILDENKKETLLLKCEELLKCLSERREELGISSNEFDEVRRKKNDRNGALKCGYVLQETQMRTQKQQNNSKMELPICFDYTRDEYPELTGLLFENITYVDYRKSETQELIIRIKYPLCLDIWQNEIAGKHVEEVFGKNSRLLIEVERVREHYDFTLYLMKDYYEQLTLDIAST